jgi:hypothetical protein
MEYLLTYGWAILIIVVVIGALWKMGVFSPNEKQMATAEACEIECGKDNMEFDRWYRDDRCVVCKCIENKPINCKVD